MIDARQNRVAQFYHQSTTLAIINTHHHKDWAVQIVTSSERSFLFSMTLSTSSLIVLSTSLSQSDFAISSEQHNQMKSVKHLHWLFSKINDAFFTAFDSLSIIAFFSRRSWKRWCQCTQYEKLQIIIKKLQEMRWSVWDFLFTLCENHHQHTMRKAHDQFLNFAYVDLSDHKDFLQVIEIDRKDTLFSKWDWNWVAKTLQQEIKTLTKHDVFESFQSFIEMTELESLNLIKQTVLTIELLIFQWLKLIEVVCQKTWLWKLSTIAIKYSLMWCVVIIFMILIHIMQLNQFINFQTVMRLYLYQESARWWVLDTLCQLELIAFYITLQWWMKTLIAEAERRVQIIDQVFNDIFMYDNLEFTENKRDEWVNDQRVFRSITFCLVISDCKFNNELMKQYMWHLSSSLLSSAKIVKRLLLKNMNHEVCSFTSWLSNSKVNYFTISDSFSSHRVYHLSILHIECLT